MVRTPCCKAEGLKKGAWTREEDQKLIAYVSEHGEGGWRTLPEKAGLKRCGKSCRLRWANYLRPDIKRGDFSQEEEETIVQLHEHHGNKWSAIARRLPGRTDNEIKNYWNTYIKKKLMKKGIDSITHKPISGKSDSESDRKANKDGHQKMPLSLSAKLLNKFANKFAGRVQQSVLTEIIDGATPIINDINSNNSIESECVRSTSSSTATSELLSKINQNKFQCVLNGDDNSREGHASSTSTATFSESSVSVNDPSPYNLYRPMEGSFNGVSSESEYSDVEFSRFLTNISNDEDLMRDNANCENYGFMKEITKTLHDGPYAMGMMVVNESDIYTKGPFGDIESYWNDYMEFDI